VFNKAGIGTYTIPQIAKPMMAKLHKALDTMVGVHLNAHVMGMWLCVVFFHQILQLDLTPGGYEFIMQNCQWFTFELPRKPINPTLDEAGDKISLFGAFAALSF